MYEAELPEEKWEGVGAARWRVIFSWSGSWSIMRLDGRRGMSFVFPVD